MSKLSNGYKIVIGYLLRLMCHLHTLTCVSNSRRGCTVAARRRHIKLVL